MLGGLADNVWILGNDVLASGDFPNLISLISDLCIDDGDSLKVNKLLAYYLAAILL